MLESLWHQIGTRVKVRLQILQREANSLALPTPPRPYARRQNVDDLLENLGKEISTRPFQLVTGRKWVGTAFGGYKSRSEVPQLVDEHLSGELPLSHFVTHRYQGVGAIKEAIGAMHTGEVLRAVVTY